MKYFHNLKVTVFVNPGEDEERIVHVLRSLFPFSLEEEKIEIKRQNAKGFQEKNIIIYEVCLVKESHTTRFWNALKANLNDMQKEKLLRELKLRLDEEFNFFIRLDKQALLQGFYSVTDSGSCYHIKFSTACFPKSRESAIKCLESAII